MKQTRYRRRKNESNRSIHKPKLCFGWLGGVGKKVNQNAGIKKKPEKGGHIPRCAQQRLGPARSKQKVHEKAEPGGGETILTRTASGRNRKQQVKKGEKLPKVHEGY